MGSNSEQFLQLRAGELSNLYAQDFTKKEAIATGKKMIDNLLENGESDKLQVMANLARIKEVINSADSELRKHLPQEKTECFGVTFTPVNGGNTINYSEDPIYVQLEKDLKARQELLKLAQKQEVLDTYGNEVPKVSTTPRKSSVTITF